LRQRRIGCGFAPSGTTRLVASLLGLFTVLLGQASASAHASDASMWGYDLSGSRYYAAAHTIRPSDLRRLTLRWAFAVPGSVGQQSQPAVVNGYLYFGGGNGVFYALDATTGKPRWQFKTSKVARIGRTANPLRDGPAVANGLVYFGDRTG